MPEFLAEMVHRLIDMKYKPDSSDRLLSFDNPSNLSLNFLLHNSISYKHPHIKTTKK